MMTAPRPLSQAVHTAELMLNAIHDKETTQFFVQQSFASQVNDNGDFTAFIKLGISVILAPEHPDVAEGVVVQKRGVS